MKVSSRVKVCCLEMGARWWKLALTTLFKGYIFQAEDYSLVYVMSTLFLLALDPLWWSGEAQHSVFTRTN